MSVKRLCFGALAGTALLVSSITSAASASEGSGTSVSPMATVRCFDSFHGFYDCSSYGLPVCLADLDGATRNDKWGTLYRCGRHHYEGAYKWAWKSLQGCVSPEVNASSRHRGPADC